MITYFYDKLAKKLAKHLKLAIIGDKSTLKFQLWYKNMLISEDFVVLSMLNFENEPKTPENVH